MIDGLAGPWSTLRDSALSERRGHDLLRAAGAGPDHDLVFVDRVIVTLVVLRFQLPHQALAELYRTSHLTIGRAVREIRRLLASRGFAVPDRFGVRLRTLEDVFAFAEAEGVTLRIDGTEVQARRPVRRRREHADREQPPHACNPRERQQAPHAHPSPPAPPQPWRIWRPPCAARRTR
ncbi:hypothetical protein OG753_01680 [Streptomyces sp. NBC_00029]|uniref:hypothetical protein n=1 Tax=Streptomyces sp. NBC_00029 TaxID=2903613 RepID=UPI003256357E